MTPDPVLVLLDCDGTMVDSQRNILRAMRLGFEAVGKTPPEDAAIRRIVGLHVETAVAQLDPDLTAAEVDLVAETYRGAFAQFRQSPNFEEPLYPGLVAALEALTRAGYLLGVVTGKSRRGLEVTLTRNDLGRYFQILKTSDDGPGKPAPDIALDAMAAMAVTPARTFVVGDTSFDMEMGRRAGITPIGVLWGYHTRADLEAAGARAVIGDFSELAPLLVKMLATKP